MDEAPPFRSVLQLRDGRALAYREWGDLGGSPVVFIHGVPGSSLWSPDPHQATTRACGVRLISVDRPGVGGSDVRPGLTVGGWADDVAELADGRPSIKKIVEALEKGASLNELILVSEPDAATDQWVLVEGHTRATAYVCHGASTEVEVLIGFSPGVVRWRWF
jgi:hypothetical protein